MAQISKEEPSQWGISASLLAHALLFVALLLSPAVPRLMLQHEESVTVEIISPQQFGATVEPMPAKALPVEPETLPPSPAAAPKVGTGMIVARTMLLEKTLADPRSRLARRDLATFADTERVVQLCSLETMDQVQAWRADFHPDRLVAYALSDIRSIGNRISADGAAFRSLGNWYGIMFECEVSNDHSKVVALRFKVDDAVPRKEREELGLPVVH